MAAARTVANPAKAQVQALFDSLALEYVRERERQFSFISQKRIVVEMLRASRCRLAVGDVERLEFSEGSFDAVLAMGVLEYLPSRDAALREMVRVLRPGGHVVLTVPNRAAAYHVAASTYLALRRLVGRPRRAAYPAKPCLPWELDRQLAGLGMRKLESQACNFIFFPLKELHERASDALNRALAPLSRLPVAPLLDAQYIVKAQKTAWRYG